MTQGLTEIWVYLTASPLGGLTVTLLAYLAGNTLYEKSGQNPLLNPVAIAIALLVGLLWLTGTSYDVYFDGAQFVHFLLGPATVALAVPLAIHAGRVRRLLLPILLALFTGSLTGILSAMILTKLFGGSAQTILSMAPKSVTTPVAMGIAEKIGGLPSLTAVLVIMTGIVGATTATSLFRLLRIREDSVRGFAIGVASHGIGTARAFQVSELAGAFAGLAMGFNALLTALLAPVVVKLLG
jgi:predicted murein hydrolase (TIGR00659 family)